MELSTPSWLFYPTIMYAAWQFAYLFKTEVVSKTYLDENVDVETSLRWLARDKKNFSNKIAKNICVKLNIMKKDDDFDSTALKTKLIFVGLNFIYFAITILPTALLFKYKYVQLFVMCLAILCSIWQGANYYIEVFSERYHDSLEKKAKQLDEQYLFIDENLDSLLNENWSNITDGSDIDGEYDSSDEYTDGNNENQSSS
eukprot:UN13285